MFSGNDEIIKSFLVGLGFDVDQSSLAVFNKAIQTAALRVTTLYGAVNAFAGSMVFAFSKISESFEQMGYEYHLIAPAINKAIILRNEMLKAYSAAGINIRKVIVASINLNMSLAKTKFAMEAIYKSVGSKFFGLLQKQSDAFRKRLYQNMPYIINALEKLVGVVFKAFDAVTTLGMRIWSILSRVYDFFVDLDRATNGWSTTILAVIAAWKFLNLAFLATPLGALLAGFLALLALWDDFKTFKEGGQSLINWGSDTTKMVVGLVGAIGTVAAVVYAAKTAFTALTAVLEVYKTIMGVVKNITTLTAIATAVLEAPIWLIVGAIGALIAGLTLADQKWQIFGGHLSGFFTGVGGKVLDWLGGGASSSPLGSNTTNNNSSKVIANQQTSINVMGSPNANATGNAVASAQNSVNRDMVRNLKGATR